MPVGQFVVGTKCLLTLLIQRILQNGLKPNNPADMEFVKNFTPSDFQAKNFTPQFHLILTVLVRKTQKMSEN